MQVNNHPKNSIRQNQNLKRASLFMAASIAVMATGANAATLTWDSAGSSPTAPVDGAGTWDATTLLWSSGGAADAAWANSPGTDTAVFGSGSGTAGIVTLGTNINVGALNFNAPGSGSYTIGNSSTYHLNLSTGAVNVQPGVIAAITSPVSGTNGLTLTGGGTLNFGGTTTPVLFTGDTTVNNSTLNFGNLVPTANYGVGSGVGSTLYLKGATANFSSGVAASKAFTLSQNVSVDPGTDATISSSYRLSIGSGAGYNLSGSATSTLNIVPSIGTPTADREYFYLNASNFPGTLNVQPAKGREVFFSNGGSFSGLPGTFGVNGEVAVNANSTGSTITVGALTGTSTGLIDTPNVGGLTTWSSGGLNATTTFAGSITGNNALTVTGGNLTLSGTNTYTGNTSVTGGTLTIGSTGSIADSIVNVSSGGSLVANGTLASTSTLNTAGIVTFGAATGGAVLTRNLNALNISAGSVSIAPANSYSSRTLVVTGSLSIAGATDAWTGKLDLTNNDLDIQNGNITTITNQLKAGYTTGTSGILSSAAQADTTHLTAIGSIVNGTTYGTTQGSLGTFEGVNPGAGDVLLKFTYIGDTNLDGKIDGSDYSRLDNGYLNNLTGWANGDFNYDGVVNGSDYTLIDNAFNTQGAALTATIAAPDATPTAQIAVPEPAAMSLAVLGLATLRRRSRRR